MNKDDLRNKIMSGLSDSLNESKVFDPKNNKAHKEAYNSFVKWYNRWKEKLGREEIRGLIRKVTNDALGDNLDTINEAMIPGQDNDSLAFDLFLWCENTREIRENNCQPIVDNLAKKIKAGVELDETYLANSSMVDKLVRVVIETYRKEFPGTYVSSATRKNLKARVAHMLIEDADEQVYYENLNTEE